MSKSNALFDRIKEYTNSDCDILEMEAKLWDEFGATRACLVLDSTGFTRVTKAQGILYFLSLIVKMRDIAAEIIKNNNGLNFRTEADNIYAEFLSTDEALKASFELHETIDKANLKLTEQEKFKVCIGIGYGKLLLADEDGAFGDEMNIASKLGEDTANGGETLLSENAFNTLEQTDNTKSEKLNILVSGAAINYYSCYPK